VVINDFNIFCTCIRPMKADTPLIIDTNAVLTDTIILERFKVVAGRHSQIIKPSGDLELSKFAPCNLGYVYELLDTLTFRERFGVFTLERSDHVVI
jgi:hypothetical protein